MAKRRDADVVEQEAELETFLFRDPVHVLTIVRAALVDRLNPWMTDRIQTPRSFPQPLDPAQRLVGVFRGDEELAQLADALAHVMRLLEPGTAVYMPRTSTKERLS